MRKDYDKAVRDRIPEIIRESGRDCNLKVVTDNEFLPYMKDKLIEEVNEYLENGDVEELADVLEVVNRLAELSGVDIDDLENIRLRKNNERGGFHKNIILLNTE